jgi:hypothetical protein
MGKGGAPLPSGAGSFKAKHVNMKEFSKRRASRVGWAEPSTKRPHGIREWVLQKAPSAVKQPEAGLIPAEK